MTVDRLGNQVTSGHILICDFDKKRVFSQIAGGGVVLDQYTITPHRTFGRPELWEIYEITMQHYDWVKSMGAMEDEDA